jgi:hypothetical protein
MYYLERFFMKLSQTDYLKNCEELKIFARPEMMGLDLDKQFLKVQKPLVSFLVSHYKKTFKISDEKLENIKITQNDATLDQTMGFLKTLLNNY